MAFFFKKNLTAEEFVQYIKKEQQEGHVSKLTDFEIKGYEFPLREMKSAHFKNTRWQSIEAEGRTFEKVLFEDCELKNINFREVVLKDVTFKNCTLSNVVMNKAIIKNLTFEKSKLVSTDSNIDHSFRNMVADSIVFKDSELKNINFFDSKGQFYFEGAKLNDVSGMGLKEGSALYFHNSNAFDIDFSTSKLTILEVKNSTIKESKANNCNIGSMVLEDSTLDFPIADGRGYGTVTAKNTGNVVIGGDAPVKKITISDCSQLRIIEMGGMIFEDIVINNCNPSELIFFESKGKMMKITNADVYDLDFRMAEIDHLILENIHVQGRLKYDGAKIKKLETKNISFDSDIEIRSEGANFELKPDKIIPAK